MRLLVSLRAIFAGFPWERTIPDYPVKLPRDPVRLRATPRGGEHTGRGESASSPHQVLDLYYIVVLVVVIAKVSKQYL